MTYKIMNANGDVVVTGIAEADLGTALEIFGGDKFEPEGMSTVDSMVAEHAVPNFNKESIDAELADKLDKTNKQKMYRDWDTNQAAIPVGDVAYGMPYTSYVKSVADKTAKGIVELEANKEAPGDVLRQQQVLMQMLQLTDNLDLSDDEKLEIATKLLQKNPVNTKAAAEAQIASLKRIAEANPGIAAKIRDWITYPGRAIGAGADALFTDAKFEDSMANFGADDPLYARDEDGNTIMNPDGSYQDLGERNWLSGLLQSVTRDPATPILAATTPFTTPIAAGLAGLIPKTLGKGVIGQMGANIARASVLPTIEGTLYEGLNLADEQLAGINESRGRENTSGGSRIGGIALGGLAGGLLGNMTRAATDKMKQQAARTYMLNQGVPNKFTKDGELIESAVNTLDNKWDQNHMKQVNQEIGDLRKRDINASVKPIKDNSNRVTKQELVEQLEPKARLGLEKAPGKTLYGDIHSVESLDDNLAAKLENIFRTEPELAQFSQIDDYALRSPERIQLIDEAIESLQYSDNLDLTRTLRDLKSEEVFRLGGDASKFKDKYGFDWDDNITTNLDFVEGVHDPLATRDFKSVEGYNDLSDLEKNFDVLQQKNIVNEEYTGTKDIKTVQDGINDLLGGQRAVLDAKIANTNRLKYPKSNQGVKQLLDFEPEFNDPRIRDIKATENGYTIPATVDDIAKIEPQDLLKLRSSIYDQTNFNKNKMQGTRAGDKANTLKARAITDYLYGAENLMPGLSPNTVNRNKMYDKLFAQSHPLHKLIGAFEHQVNTYNPSDDVLGDALGSIATGNIMGSAGILKNMARNEGNKTRLLADLMTPKSPSATARLFPDLYPESTGILQTYMDKNLDDVIVRSPELQNLLTPDYGTNFAKWNNPVPLIQDVTRPIVTETRQDQARDRATSISNGLSNLLNGGE